MGWFAKLFIDDEEYDDVPGEWDDEDEAFQRGADYAEEFYPGLMDDIEIVVENDEDDDAPVYSFTKHKS